MSGILDDEEIERIISQSLDNERGYRPIQLSRAARGPAPGVHQRARSEATDFEATDFRTLAVNGSVQAQVAYGLILLRGHGVARDEDAALRWFRIAARAGSPDAYNMVGRCHELGWGVARDCTEAARWYRRAADRNHAWAQFNLASLLAQGNGVPLDHGQALSLLVKSARQGNAKAMNMLGRYREAGHDGRSKLRSAALWYRLAAKGGCFRGQFHHGRQLAAAGDIEGACNWFSASLGQAPEDFRREAASFLAQHADASIRNIGLTAASTGHVESTA